MFQVDVPSKARALMLRRRQSERNRLHVLLERSIDSVIGHRLEIAR